MSVKIGIALGGGGARGLAHVGVLKVLEEEGIPPSYITGTSIGAVVGAMYAQRPNVDAMIQRFKDSLDDEFYDQLGLDHLKTSGTQEVSFLQQTTQNIKRRIAINLAQSRTGLLKEVRLKNILLKLIDKGSIEDTKIPLAIVATSLHTGEDSVFRSGEIIDAVAASSSIPGFLCPVCLNDDLLTDGGVSCPVPVKYLPKEEVDVTIGVELGIKKYYPLECINVIEIIARADMITSRNLGQMMADTADVAICPDTKGMHWSEFSREDELIEAGIQGAKEKLPEIKSAIRKKTFWFKRLFGH
jgi:NTE family protein